ncbi:MAG: S1 RNA-binding domain-containing protein, partial [Halohasta sp.]
MTDDTAGESGERDDSRPVVYDLAPDCTLTDVEVGANYHAVVNGVVAYGVFVDISDSVSGLVHESNLDRNYGVGDRLIVELEERKENGDIAFDVPDIENYRTDVVDHEPDITPIGDLETGSDATVEGSIVQIKQTGGPTIFHVNDGTGIVAAAAFEAA